MPDTDLKPKFIPVILAGGSGTRFWPRSRKSRAKQVLALSGTDTMIQQTRDRLLPLSSIDHFLIITNDLLAGTIAAQLPDLPQDRIIREPAARNTAPACALAAMLVARTMPDAVLGVFPSDHVVADQPKFYQRVREAVAIAASGNNIVVLGAPPTRPETGYGYIQQGANIAFPGLDSAVTAVQRFTEKPDLATAEQFLQAGNYSWNAGIFFWSARTLLDSIAEFCPAMISPLETIADAFETPDFAQVFADVYPTIQSISIDYAVLEPRSQKGEGASGIFCIPADFGWNDLGSWAALHEYSQEVSPTEHSNVVEAASALEMKSTGNYVFAPGLTVALLGVQDLVVVQTDDALLITTRAHSQEVGKIVGELGKLGHHNLI